MGFSEPDICCTGLHGHLLVFCSCCYILSGGCSSLCYVSFGYKVLQFFVFNSSVLWACWHLSFFCVAHPSFFHCFWVSQLSKTACILYCTRKKQEFWFAFKKTCFLLYSREHKTFPCYCLLKKVGLLGMREFIRGPYSSALRPITWRWEHIIQSSKTACVLYCTPRNWVYR